MNLSQTNKEVLRKMRIAEEAQRFHEHLEEQKEQSVYPVTSYEVNLLQKIFYFILKIVIIKPFCWIANHFWLKTIIFGKYNLKSIKGGAIVTCNHVNKLDVVALDKALQGYPRGYTIDEDHNVKSTFGTLMRAFGTMVLPKCLSKKKMFQSFLKEELNLNKFITFFPEESEWWCYEKPRPLQIGAFHYAAKFQVPIIPIFITFIKTGKKNREGIEQRQFIVHILKPIYPDKNASLKENKESLHSKTTIAYRHCYEGFYYQRLK